MSETSHVPAGYELDRDDKGLTSNERWMLSLLRAGSSVSAAARTMGLTRQRGHQLVTALVKKGAVKKEGNRYVSTD